MPQQSFNGRPGAHVCTNVCVCACACLALSIYQWNHQPLSLSRSLAWSVSPSISLFLYLHLPLLLSFLRSTSVIAFTSFTHFLLFFPHQVLNADPYGIAMTQDHPLHEYLRGHSLNVIRDTATRKQMLQTWKLEDKEETLGQGDDDSSKVQALFWQYYGYAMLILVRLWLEYISMDIYIHVHIRAYPQAHVKRKQTQTCLHEISFGIQVHARARARTHTHTHRWGCWLHGTWLLGACVTRSRRKTSTRSWQRQTASIIWRKRLRSCAHPR